MTGTISARAILAIFAGFSAALFLGCGSDACGPGDPCGPETFEVRVLTTDDEPVEGAYIHGGIDRTRYPRGHCVWTRGRSCRRSVRYRNREGEGDQPYSHLPLGRPKQGTLLPAPSRPLRRKELPAIHRTCKQGTEEIQRATKPPCGTLIAAVGRRWYWA